MKTLKQEEVYRTEYRNLVHARAAIGEFLEKVYNEKRLHSALDYRSPVQFERTLVRRMEPEAANGKEQEVTCFGIPTRAGVQKSNARWRIDESCSRTENLANS